MQDSALWSPDFRRGVDERPISRLVFVLVLYRKSRKMPTVNAECNHLPFFAVMTYIYVESIATSPTFGYLSSILT